MGVNAGSPIGSMYGGIGRGGSSSTTGSISSGGSVRGLLKGSTFVTYGPTVEGPIVDGGPRMEDSGPMVSLSSSSAASASASGPVGGGITRTLQQHNPQIHGQWLSTGEL